MLIFLNCRVTERGNIVFIYIVWLILMETVMSYVISRLVETEIILVVV